MNQWSKDFVSKAKAKRNWKNLPAQFEANQVKFCFNSIKDHFCKITEIKQRIAASKARTFEELEVACDM